MAEKEGETVTVPENDKTGEGELNVESARELLLKAGLHVVEPEKFHEIKTNAAKPEKDRANALEQQLAKMKTEYEALAKYKQDQENAGKSEAEILKQRQAAWEKENAQNQTALEEHQKTIEVLKSQLNQERVENRIKAILSDSTNTDAALMWAQKHVGNRLSIDDENNLVWTTPTGVPHIGVAAVNLLKEWWESPAQGFLRKSSPAGPDTKGAPNNPQKSNGEYQRLDPAKSTLAERLEHARRWHAQQDKGNN